MQPASQSEAGAGIAIETHLRELSEPANLRINDQIRKYRAACCSCGCTEPYHHFAFGQSPFPPPPTVAEALRRHAGEHSYLPTAGLPELREAIAAYQANCFDVPCGPSQVLVTPGSKDLISLVLAALQGTVLIPTPAWVSYMPQARMLRKRVVSMRLRREDGFKLTPDTLQQGLAQASHPQRILIFNHPNNPTGAVYDRTELEALAEVCRQNGVVVLSDEIYALTAFDEKKFTSFAAVYPEGTVVSTGLSKDRSCGGYRLGAGIFPARAHELFRSAVAVAGSTFSCVAAPIQHAAVEAYSGSTAVEDYIRSCRSVHAVVGGVAATMFNALPGVRSTTPRGAFYLYVDFNDHRPELQSLGFGACAQFAEDLLAVEHTAILPGEALLLPQDDFSSRCSFVDYDGAAVLDAWRRAPPEDDLQREQFVRQHCPLVAGGIRRIARYFEQVRGAKRPQHA